MTIASEISRLQTAKTDMKTAIVNKGVSVADSVSLSNYCDCINAISSGGKAVEVLVVGGGGAGTYTFGGGGGGGVVRTLFQISGGRATVTVGNGGTTCCASGGYSQVLSGDNKVCATGGGGGSYVDGGTSGRAYINSTCIGGGKAGGTGVCDSRGTDWYGGGGGGGAGGAGCAGTTGNGSDGGVGLYGYGGGGGGGSDRCGGTGVGAGVDGGGTGENRCQKRFCCNANNYGGGGGGAERYRACGCQGVVDVCYSLYGLSGFTCATGGNCCYNCDGMRVHRFTSSGTFTIVS